MHYRPSLEHIFVSLPFFQFNKIIYIWNDPCIVESLSLPIFPSLQIQNEGRLKVREALTPEAMQMALQRVISFPCKKQYTVVILMPKPSRWDSLISIVSWSSGGFSRDAKVRYCIFHAIVSIKLFTQWPRQHCKFHLLVQVLAGMAAALVLAASLWRYSRGTLRS